MPLKQKLDLPIPDIPGKKIASNQRDPILEMLKKIFGVKDSNFLGAQPVSFGKQHLDTLLTKNYYVCEKTDGVRLLLLTFLDAQKMPQSFMIDRKNDFYHVANLFFPRFSKDGTYKHQDFTLLDGELVFQVNNDIKTMVYLAFDLLSFHSQSIIKEDFAFRQNLLRNHVIEPFNYLMRKDEKLRNRMNLPFSIIAKKMELCYGIRKIIEYDMPILPHNSDGLIFTSVNDPYVIGTCNTMLKWKPPNENSIDFKLKAKKEGSLYKFGLFVWKGEGNYEFYAEMKVTREQFETTFKSKIESLTNGKGVIVEVVRSEDKKNWIFYRFRSDKLHGNYHTIVEKINKTISDAIDSETLINICPKIREKWKEREALAQKRSEENDATVTK